MKFLNFTCFVFSVFVLASTALHSSDVGAGAVAVRKNLYPNDGADVFEFRVDPVAVLQCFIIRTDSLVFTPEERCYQTCLYSFRYLNPAKGETLWVNFDGERNLEMTASIPPAGWDCFVIESGIYDHMVDTFGGSYVKICSTTLTNVDGNQVCGAIGIFINGVLHILKVGLLDYNPELFNDFIGKIELFASQNGAENVKFDISEENDILFDLFCGSGYEVADQYISPDSGRTVYFAGKTLMDQSHHPDSENTFDFQWCPLCDSEEATKIIDASFSPTIKYRMEDLCPEDEGLSSRSIGVFVRNESGKVLGGCCGRIRLKPQAPTPLLQAPVSHIHIDSVWLKKSLRGSGLGTMFLSYIENIAAQRFGCVVAELISEEFFAHRLYRKTGYTEEVYIPGSSCGNDGKRYASYVFCKNLIK
jgi:ribosomal protein S18 acetylase RimI-like enzyme